MRRQRIQGPPGVRAVGGTGRRDLEESPVMLDRVGLATGRSQRLGRQILERSKPGGPDLHFLGGGSGRHELRERCRTTALLEEKLAVAVAPIRMRNGTVGPQRCSVARDGVRPLSERRYVFVFVLVALGERRVGFV